MKNKLEKILFIPDTHRPYHDKKAFELVMKVGKQIKPDHVIIGGDFMDNYSVSSHSKDPNRALQLDKEVEDTIKGLKEIKAIGAKNNVFIEGNHEDRLTRYLMDKAPELYNVISIPSILKLNELGYKFVPYRDYYKIGKLSITHDLGKAGKFAHYAALNDFQNNIIINHTHRIGYAVEGTAQGVKHVSAMFGWLGDVNTVDYKHKALAHKEWSLGFGLGYLDTSTGNVYVQPVPIINYSCLVEGKLIK